MIQKIPFNLSLTIGEYKRLVNKKIWHGDQWVDPDIEDIKAKIRTQLVANQIYCAYCGLPFKGPKDKQIEHIAPKASSRQPQFTFTLHNLVLSCGYCNDLIVKGTKPTVVLPENRLYKKCAFLIVHPYFDDPDLHYDWTENEDKILIQEKEDSEKGKYSIAMFSLDSQEMSELRAAVVYYEKRKKEKPLNEDDISLISETLEYSL